MTGEREREREREKEKGSPRPPAPGSRRMLPRAFLRDCERLFGQQLTARAPAFPLLLGLPFEAMPPRAPRRRRRRPYSAPQPRSPSLLLRYGSIPTFAIWDPLLFRGHHLRELDVQRGKNGLYVVARNFCLALPGSCLAKHTWILV